MEQEQPKLEKLIACLHKKPKFEIGSKTISTRNSSKTKNINEREDLGQLLEWFSSQYQKERSFSNHTYKKLFVEVFEGLVEDKNFAVINTPENILRAVICLRMIMRDANFQQRFVDSDGLLHFAEMFHTKSKSYLKCSEEAYVCDIVANLASIFQKLVHTAKYHSVLLNNSIHKTMLHLLRASDVFVLHCALNVLVVMAECEKLRNLIIDLHSVEIIIQIIQEFDDFSKCCAANLLRLLSSDTDIREQMMIYDSLPVLLSVLNDGEQCTLLWHVVWTLVRLCSDVEHANEIRLLGGIPLILNLLHKDRPLTCGRFEISSGYARRGHSTVTHSNSNKEELVENKLKLYSACCAVLNELALDDRCTQTIVQTNGIYLIAKFILPQKTPERCRSGGVELQRNAFRALRFLFSMERNRKMFKRLFPTDMFQTFIDIGHYVRDINAYKSLVDRLNSMKPSAIDEIREGVEELNQNKTPKRYIRDYAIYDILGSGAFGSVYRVKKRSTQTPLALKEVNIAGGGGKTGKERQKREIDEIVRELKIIREQLKHPNVVRYYSTFQENDKLYIEMELIEGASLQEHFTSLKEKGENGMGEARLWRIFIQMCLALRYLHCDKRIVHRDLTPNNVMLGENDKVTITDFGLAKQKKDTSKMTSVVGTILYFCPEIIKNEPYGEKADIWALGCILHQIAKLDPPFDASNMLSLATKIVDAVYDPIPENSGYSDLVNKTVKRCLTVKPSERPDIVDVSGMIADPLLRYTDQLASQHMVAEKRVEKERRRTQKHFYEARKNRQDYQTLFQASQESSEKYSRNFEISNGSSSSSQNQDNPQSSRSNSSDTDVFITGNGHDEASDPSTLCPSSSNNSSGGNEKMESPARVMKKPRPVSAGTKLPHPPSPDIRAAAPRRALSFDMTGSKSNSGDSRPTSSARSSVIKDFPRSGLNSRGRPGSSGSSSARMLSISPSKVRQISDPVQQSLIQLHKIIYIDQLPPTSEVNYRRRIISRYKRALFSPHSRSMGLKDELKKLLQGSHETIDVSFIVEAPSLTQKANAEAEARELLGNCYVSAGTNGSKLYEEGITYVQMQNIIERVLKDSGYYDIANKPKSLYSDVMHRCRTVPDTLADELDNT